MKHLLLPGDSLSFVLTAIRLCPCGHPPAPYLLYLSGTCPVIKKRWLLHWLLPAFCKSFVRPSGLHLTCPVPIRHQSFLQFLPVYFFLNFYNRFFFSILISR